MFQYVDHSRVLPERRNVMDAEDRIEIVDKCEYRPRRKMLPGPVPGTIWARSLNHPEAPDRVLNLVSVG